MTSHNRGAESETTLEWFGATTFRLKALGLTIFLDAWLERPDTVASYISVDDIDECDYILISHAHFDQLAYSLVLSLSPDPVLPANHSSC